MSDAWTLFGAAFSGFAVAGIFQKIINVFIDRYVANPLNNKLGELESLIISYLKEVREKESKVEAVLSELKKKI